MFTRPLSCDTTNALLYLGTRTASNRLEKECNEEKLMFILWKFHNYAGRTRSLCESRFPFQEHPIPLSHMPITMTQTCGPIRETQKVGS